MMESETLIAAHNLKGLSRKSYDVIVIGSGIAGMSVALTLDPKLRIAVVSKQWVKDSSTYKAQGGMAVAIGRDDSPEQHIDDSLKVGQGVCRYDALEVMVREGPSALRFLETLGASFNRSDGELFLTREAGHSRRRVVHYYDYTGRHIAETMIHATMSRNNIELLDDHFVIDLLTDNDRCYGCVIECAGQLMMVQAGAVVIATGGYSGLFSRSTNSTSASGDGIAAAYRAGALLADLEFVQFHPTTFLTSSGEIFLLTEALRGEGAYLRNKSGDRFMHDYHSDGELAPRDEVSRAITAEMKRYGAGCVYLDATHLGREYLADRFRQVYAMVTKSGYDLGKDWIPIAPAAHYTIGGVWTDLWGRTTIAGLYCCGEAAATGAHGANRLASNSLLEGVVFGRRVGQSIHDHELSCHNVEQISVGNNSAVDPIDVQKLGRAMDDFLGVRRNEQGLRALAQFLQDDDCNHSKIAAGGQRKLFHAYNARQLATLILDAAVLRRESRGTHFRTDYPKRNDDEFSKHIYHRWGRKAILDE